MTAWPEYESWDRYPESPPAAFGPHDNYGHYESDAFEHDLSNSSDMNESNRKDPESSTQTARDVPDEQPQGAIHVHSDKSRNEPFPSNYIRTTKYTLITFLPLNLLEQFRKVSNIYFLCNMIIALMPGIAPIFPITSILPLVFVLAVAAVKDAVEDNRRYRADRAANGKQAIVIRDNQELKVRSDEIEVGDFIVVEKNDEFPADVVVLSTGLEAGVCYIETMNLDGETNLKSRAAPTVTQHLHDPAELCRTRVEIECDAPNESLVKWEGVLRVNDSQPQPLNLPNVLFRGCKLRNTPWIYAIVVYTGKNTKMMQNLKEKPTKFSSLDRKLNRLVLVLLAFQLTIIVTLSICSAVWTKADKQQNAWHLRPIPFFGYSGAAIFFLSLLTFFVLLTYMMPISLFVSMELCKAFQATFMRMDLKLSTETRTCQPKTSNLNEELSQIEYIFTDKTGTLTENEMRFYRAVVPGIVHDELDHPGALRDVLQADPQHPGMQYMLALGLCHTVVVAKEENSDEAVYEGTSTDEVAIVDFAKSNGFVLINRSAQQIDLDVLGQQELYDILAVLEFNSDRKRMGVVLRDPSGGVLLVIKGADSHVLPLCTPNGPDEEQFIQFINDELKQASREGLRTLVVAQRYIDENEYQTWKQEWDTAAVALSDRQGRIAAAAAAIERDLTLLGMTAVEDRLQDGVPETIHFFLRAGIVIWMLTGDNRETATNIASSCRLVEEGDKVYHVEATSLQELKSQLAEVTANTERDRKANIRVTVIIDGKTLEVVFAQCVDEFSALGNLVSSAVCCRVTPLQKAMVVALFQGQGKTALGVGDGANDVSMIQEAKVGIGIMGLEGAQAERAADYAIPKFRHLKRLCSVHGRFSLVRNAQLIQFSFYKNFFLAFIQIFFAFYNGESGQTLLDSWFLTFYNIAFTSLPPLLMGVFEKDLHDDIVERHPELFTDLRKGQFFNPVSIATWMGLAVYHAVVVFFLISATYPIEDLRNWRTSGLWPQGMVIGTTVLTVVMGKAILTTRHWTWIPVVGIVFSYLLYYTWILFYSCFVIFFGTSNFYYVSFAVLSDIKLWLWLLFGVLGLLVPDTAILFLQRRFWPSLRDLVQDHYAGVRHDKELLQRGLDLNDPGHNETVPPEPLPAHTQPPPRAQEVVPAPPYYGDYYDVSPVDYSDFQMEFGGSPAAYAEPYTSPDYQWR
eukprot:TRINITY_DN4015_c0_g1_i1.p1 TRINITY_DN4015_c0_g1~~TRINITY_DN4015_c0_g1_i1.p1  ORF type:complete len:1191 (-),score=188.74 TRINITY_DN4015_c0_g1_i1:51-3623(-)